MSKNNISVPSCKNCKWKWADHSGYCYIFEKRPQLLNISLTCAHYKPMKEIKENSK